MFLAIRAWAASLSSRDKYKYLVKIWLLHVPNVCTISVLPPTEYRKLAPPLRKLCPEKSAASRPAFPRRSFILAVKGLWVR